MEPQKRVLNIEKLTTEHLELIISNLPRLQLSTTALVSRSWSTAMKSDTVWRRRYSLDFVAGEATLAKLPTSTLGCPQAWWLLFFNTRLFHQQQSFVTLNSRKVDYVSPSGAAVGEICYTLHAESAENQRTQKFVTPELLAEAGRNDHVWHLADTSSYILFVPLDGTRSDTFERHWGGRGGELDKEQEKAAASGLRWLRHTARDPMETQVLATAEPVQVHPLSQKVAWGRVNSDAPPAMRRLSYFEVEVVGGASVGLASFSDHNAGDRARGFHVGHRLISYGYHSDDGTKWRSDRTKGISNGVDGEAYGPAYGNEVPRWITAEGDRVAEPPPDEANPRDDFEAKGDVVGCGIDFETRELFFTLNGEMLGVAFREVEIGNDLSPAVSLLGAKAETQLHPCVALHSKHDRVRINLGSAPFRFDLASCLYKSRALPEPDLSKAEKRPEEEGMNPSGGSSLSQLTPDQIEEIMDMAQNEILPQMLQAPAPMLSAMGLAPSVAAYQANPNAATALALFNASQHMQAALDGAFEEGSSEDDSDFDGIF